MELLPTNFKNDETQYISPSWDDLDDFAFSISEQIIKDDLQFDRIITLARGGWPMARPIIDYLQAKKSASIGIKLYTGINERESKPEIYQDLTEDITQETILLFDDVSDTGASLEYVKKYLEERGAKKIHTATLFYKPHSIIKPDYFAHETKAWVVFPYDLRETMSELVVKWEGTGLKSTEIINRFINLGFQRKKVEYFYSLLFNKQ
jgi:hypoxanthine phosphoribosyltransferase